MVMGVTNSPEARKSPHQDTPSTHAKDPTKFSPAKKKLVVLIGIVIGINANLGASLPVGATDIIADRFAVSSPPTLVLLSSLYLLGYAFGPIVFGPLSEHVGRRPVLLGSSTAYVVFTACCGAIPTLPRLYGVLLLFRFLAGVTASAPIAVIGALYADVYDDDPEARGHAVAYFTSVGVAASSMGPLVSGYASLYSWNLPFWVGVALGGASLPFIACLPETYAPVLNREASTSSASQRQLRPVIIQFLKEMKELLSKPFIMFVKEPIVLLTSLYCAYLYAMFFLYLQAYPIIFKGVYEMSPDEVGLTFLPITAGCLLSMIPYLAYCSHHKRALLSGQNWATRDEYRRLPLACFGGPIIVATVFWLGWTADPSTHPAVPIMSGLPFGIGYLVIFIAMFNYLNDAYRQHAAPAHAAAGTARSLVAVCLPLAAPRMYGDLGVRWACSVLGFLVLALSLIPFAFIKYGEAIRRRSPLAQKILYDSKQAPSPSGTVLV